MQPPKAVLLDWDGTLYDSTQLCFEIYRELFSRFKAGKLTYEKFREEFSADYHRYQEMHGIGRERHAEFDDAWDEVYSKRKHKGKLFSEASKLLEAMKARNTPVALVTNGTKDRILGEIDAYKLSGYFGAVVTIEDANWQFKPSPELIHLACKKLGVKEKDSIYVGDMAEDIMAGKAAGALTGAVSTGVHTVERLSKEEPDFLFSSVGDVLGIL